MGLGKFTEDATVIPRATLGQMTVQFAVELVSSLPWNTQRPGGDHQAADHDMGCEEKYTPFGLVDEDGGQLDLAFGSSAKTSDFIADSRYDWWERLPPDERQNFTQLQIKADNGPESNGRRTPFLKRIVEFADHIGKPIQLLYYPPYHSKYNPVERCWGILEKHWNGAKRTDVDALLGWAKSMTWKGVHPVVELSRKVYQKGISLSKEAQQGSRQSEGPWCAFSEAATVLLDEYALSREDPDAIGEQRFVALGMSATGALLGVVHAPPARCLPNHLVMEGFEAAEEGL